MSYNEKNTTNLLGKLNVGNDTNINGDATVQENINLGEKLQPIDVVVNDTTSMLEDFLLLITIQV